MPATATQLVVADGVILKAIADGCVAVLSDGPPIALGPLHEKVTTLCQRATSRAELVEILSETGSLDSAIVEATVDELLDAGLLRSTGPAA